MIKCKTLYSEIDKWTIKKTLSDGSVVCFSSPAYGNWTDEERLAEYTYIEESLRKKYDVEKDDLLIITVKCKSGNENIAYGLGVDAELIEAHEAPTKIFYIKSKESAKDD